MYRANTIQCTECCEWVHRRCSDTKVPLIKVQGFRWMCLAGRDNKDRIKDLVLENGEVIEGVGQLCYLGNVLNGGGSSVASINRVRSDWKKFREPSGVLTNKKVALRLKGRVQGADKVFGSIFKIKLNWNPFSYYLIVHIYVN